MATGVAALAVGEVGAVGAVEAALVQGDLARLTPEQRVSYYQRVCDSLGLNPLTQPFAYLTLNGKLTLYARKDATDQLRRLHRVSIEPPQITFQDEWILVTVAARATDGRTDADVGVVSRKDMRGDFGNALMKAVTKSKRRVTLSICGLGMLDETEVETIPDAVPHPDPPRPQPAAARAAKANGYGHANGYGRSKWTLPELAAKLAERPPPVDGSDLQMRAMWVIKVVAELDPAFDPQDLDEAVSNWLNFGDGGWTYAELSAEAVGDAWLAVVSYVQGLAKNAGGHPANGKPATA